MSTEEKSPASPDMKHDMIEVPVAPPKAVVETLIAPLKTYFSPRIYGLDKIEKERPALYVSNHSIYGVTDGLFLGVEMFLQKDIMLRTLVDYLHTSVPGWKHLIKNVGMVGASRDSCRQLMEQGEHILVFPGGRREVCKQKGEEYQLIWRNRYGFARMAIQAGYDIIPVAAIGGEELYKILFDSKEMMRSPLGVWLQDNGMADHYLHGGEHLPPITKGLGLTGLPRPERIYIKVGDRIGTQRFAHDVEDKENLITLRAEVEAAFAVMFDDLKAYRENDTDEEWWRTLLKMF